MLFEHSDNSDGAGFEEIDVDGTASLIQADDGVFVCFFHGLWIAC